MVIDKKASSLNPDEMAHYELVLSGSTPFAQVSVPIYMVVKG